VIKGKYEPETWEVEHLDWEVRPEPFIGTAHLIYRFTKNTELPKFYLIFLKQKEGNYIPA